MDRYIRVALDAAATIREIYRRVANVNHPDDWHPLFVICENCGRIGTTIVTGWDGERVRYECRPDLVTLGHRLRPRRRGLAVRRPRQAAVQRGLGREVGPLRRDHRARRQGPLDQGWLAGPIRRDRARGVRQRAAAQRALRVPEHRRQEDVDLQGPRRIGDADRRGDPAGAAAPPLPAPASRTPPSSSTPTGPMPSRASSTSRTAWPRPPPAARCAASCPPTTSVSSPSASSSRDADVAAEAAAYRPAFSHLALLEQIPGVDVAERVTAEKGEPADRARGRDPRRAARRRARLAGGLRAGARAAGGAARRAAARGRRGRRRPARVPRRACRRARGGRLERRGRPGRHLRHRQGARPAGRRAFAAIYLAFLGRPSGPRAGWLLAALDRDFVVGRLREAAGAGVAA